MYVPSQPLRTAVSHEALTELVLIVCWPLFLRPPVGPGAMKSERNPFPPYTSSIYPVARKVGVSHAACNYDRRLTPRINSSGDLYNIFLRVRECAPFARSLPKYLM